MIDKFKPKTPQKRTPANATAFEREQLHFFLSSGDLGTALNNINPSLAWLPILSEMNLIKSERDLIAWIERNLADLNAIRDVVDNIRFFGPETGDFLSMRLNAQILNLSRLIVDSWSLIIRHMRSARRGLALNEWFEIAPKLKQRDYSNAVLEQLANALRPTLRIGKRFDWRHTEEQKAPERPTDLMSVDFKINEGISSIDVLAAWPRDAGPEIDEDLLSKLTDALNAALADATDVGVEDAFGYSASDADVPSVAAHSQNRYRGGFQTIVRVMAEVWARLAAKSPAPALRLAERWRTSPFRLVRRLALFACTNPGISGDSAADTLIELPAGELFLTSSSIEVYRLIRSRWNDFPKEKQRRILQRICEGPPRDWFRPGADIDRYIDRDQFEILSDMVREGFDIGPEATKVLNDIRTRWPQWRPRPREQAGFHVWHESGTSTLGDGADKLKGVPDDALVARAREIASTADFMDGDSWQGLCASSPDRALRGLDAAASRGEWPADYWEQLLRSHTPYVDVETQQRVAQRLLDWPNKSFDKLAAAASSWLRDHMKTLPDNLLWSLWDRIAEVALIDTIEPSHG